MTDKSYEKTIRDLYQLQQFSVKQGLDNIRRLIFLLGDPHQAYPVIHIAGTNGKGSTSALIHRILSAHGFMAGLYTSPHLVDFRERIRINDDMIGKDYITRYWAEMKKVVTREKATFFDTTTAMAFSYFRDKNIDIAIIETGLGGRLDSTNIVKPVAAVLTPIHRDHTKQLGKKLSLITREKADIIKSGCTVFCGRQHANVYRALQPYHTKAGVWHFLKDEIRLNLSTAGSMNASFELKDIIRGVVFNELKLNLAGSHQAENAALAYLVSRWYLEQKMIAFDEFVFRDVLRTISWPGRFQKVSSNPDIILDVSHNYDGFRKTMKLVRSQYPAKKVHLLIGLLSDKEYRSIAKIIHNRFASITITNPVHERVLPAEKLKDYLHMLGTASEIIPDYQDAWRELKGKIPENEVLIVMGSHFLIGAILAADQ